MQLGHKAGFGCLGIIVVLFIVVMVIMIAHRPSPEQQAANDERVRQYNAAFACQDAVRERLKAPASAEFQAPREAQISAYEDGSYKIESYVDAQNSFGAKLRNAFTCQVAPRRNGPSGFIVLDLKMGER